VTAPLLTLPHLAQSLYSVHKQYTPISHTIKKKTQQQCNVWATYESAHSSQAHRKNNQLINLSGRQKIKIKNNESKKKKIPPAKQFYQQ
jgi:hypothetical protein